MTVPQPERPLDCHTEVLPAGSVVFRVHAGSVQGRPNPGNVFNPGVGAPTRFAFFGEPTVPVLYAGQSPQAAAYESIFHDSVPGSVVPAVAWRSKSLTVLRIDRDLTLVMLHSYGLRQQNLRGRDLTDTPASTYSDTVTWARAVHEDMPAAHGIVWMSRQFNTDRAYVFFGDRVAEQNLVPRPDHERAIDFATPAGEDWLSTIAAQMGVSLSFD